MRFYIFEVTQFEGTVKSLYGCTGESMHGRSAWRVARDKVQEHLNLPTWENIKLSYSVGTMEEHEVIELG